jgi:hypothetical protein
MARYVTSKSIHLMKQMYGYDKGDKCFCLETETVYIFVENGGLLVPDDKTILSTGEGAGTKWVGIIGKHKRSTLDSSTNLNIGDLVSLEADFSGLPKIPVSLLPESHGGSVTNNFNLNIQEATNPPLENITTLSFPLNSLIDNGDGTVSINLDAIITNNESMINVLNHLTLSGQEAHTYTKDDIGLGNVPNLDFSNASNITKGTLPSSVLPPITQIITSVNGKIGNVIVTKDDVGLSNVPNLDFRNANNITQGKLPTSVLPAISITNAILVNSIEEMLSIGNMAIKLVVVNGGNSYFRSGTYTGTMEDWIELQHPIAQLIQSVNGKIGNVIITKEDIGLGDVPNMDFSNASNITKGKLPSSVLPEIPQLVKSVNNKTGSILLTQDDIQDGANYKRTENNFTSILLNKLNGIESNAQRNIKPDWNALEHLAAGIKNKPIIPERLIISNVTGSVTGKPLILKFPDGSIANKGDGSFLVKMPEIPDNITGNITITSGANVIEGNNFLIDDLTIVEVEAGVYSLSLASKNYVAQKATHVSSSYVHITDTSETIPVLEIGKKYLIKNGCQIKLPDTTSLTIDDNTIREITLVDDGTITNTLTSTLIHNTFFINGVKEDVILDGPFYAKLILVNNNQWLLKVLG